MDDNMVKVLRYLAEQFGTPGVHRVDTPLNIPGLNFEGHVAPALRRLGTDPPYVEGLSVAEQDYLVVLTGLTQRGWDAAEAAGDARDASPGGAASNQPSTAVSGSGREFQVSLSFAGEQRSYVEQVASSLAKLSIRVFYDREQKIELWGRNQGEELQRIYMDDSFVVVMFISRDYGQKSWPIQERRATLSRAMRERREYVLPVRFDDTVLPGLDPDVSYLNAHDFSPEQLAEAIAQKIVALGASVPAVSGVAAGWARSVEGRSSSDMRVSITDESGRPVAGAKVLAVAHNGTYVEALADSQGYAILRLPARRLVTIFAAHSSLAPGLFLDHDPEDDLEVTLPSAGGVGSVIFEAGTGYVPGLAGRLAPIRDTAGQADRYHLYADNISINDQADQPYHFTPGEPLMLEDANGARVIVTIVRLIGRSSLVRFER